MKIAILGAGPAGLLAAHAVTIAGHEPTIISKKKKSIIGGAQFIHRPIRGATLPEECFPITFDMAGTGAVYTARLYAGREVPTLSSWHNYADGQTLFGYPMVQTYDRLWQFYEEAINDLTLSPESIADIERNYELVISTIPRWILDGEELPYQNWYEHREIWVRPWDPAAALGDNTIWYNGLPDGQALYRMSYIQGVTSAEFTEPVQHGLKIIKPIRFNDEGGQDKHPGIFKVGRYGRWSKMQLAHHAYSEVLNLLRPDWEI